MKGILRLPLQTCKIARVDLKKKVWYNVEVKGKSLFSCHHKVIGSCEHKPSDESFYANFRRFKNFNISEKLPKSHRNFRDIKPSSSFVKKRCTQLTLPSKSSAIFQRFVENAIITLSPSSQSASVLSPQSIGALLSLLKL